MWLRLLEEAVKLLLQCKLVIMFNRNRHKFSGGCGQRVAFFCVIFLALACPFNIFSVNPQKPYRPRHRADSPQIRQIDSIKESRVDSLVFLPADSVAALTDVPSASQRGDSLALHERKYIFNPDPTRAVWLSALFPGLGQLYNRRYWKLPIVVGAFMGLGYATSWNNGMLRDYSRAYTDLMDNDPSTKSYMDFFPPTTREEDLNRTWLTNVMKSRKDYYRRNRDLCIIAMVGVYLVAMVDAYVDASLAHFDISPNLTMDVGPALIPESRDRLPGVGLQWAFNF